MKRIAFPATTPKPAPRAVALGFFDGVHLGHRAVLQEMLAAAEGLTPAVFTFDTLPKLQGAGRLLDEAETDRLLDAMGVAELFEGSFATLSSLSPEEFVQDILVHTLHARVVCCGYNYRFGRGGSGDVTTLKALCAAQGVRVIVVPAVLADSEPVSSTRIRAAVARGDLLEANRLMGHPYTIQSPVMGGRRLGRTLGTPTINQPLAEGLVLPPFGVYASAVEVEGRVTYGVTNIGVKPTVGGTQPLAETWIPGFEGDLYGQSIPVRPVAFLRPETTFPTVEALKAQILADGEAARRRMTENTGIRAILFDFDDTLQNRPVAFLAFAKDFVRRHFPRWPAEKQEAMAKEMARLNGSGYVDYRAFLEEVKAAFDWQDAPDNDTLLADVQRHFPLFTTLLPGVAEGLQALRKMGYLTGIITNGRRLMQNRKLDVSGLRPLLDIAVVSGDEGVHKPDPELFRRTATRLGLPPEACVYVGDHPVNDMEGAKAAGMTPVFMQASGHFAPPADLPVVHNMAELLETVTKL